MNKEMVEERELFGYAYEFKYNPKVAELQKVLSAAGYKPGSSDGKMGKRTRSAIKAFQRDYGLKITGYVNKKTQTTLHKAYRAELLSFKNITPKRVQIALKNAEFNPGPVDGKIGPKTIEATIEFQESKGLMQYGEVNPETWDKLKEYLSIDELDLDSCAGCSGG